MSSSSQVSVSSSSSSSGASQSSGTAIAYTNSEGAGGHSSSSATSANGQTVTDAASDFVAGAKSAGSTAQAQASDQGATATADVEVGGEAAENEDTSESNAAHSTGNGVENSAISDPPIPAISFVLHLGTLEADVLEFTESRDLFFGGQGADSFNLGSTGVADIVQADVVLDYTAGEDQLVLSSDLAVADVTFELADRDGDGIPDSTIIRSLMGDPETAILAVIANTVTSVTIEDSVSYVTTLSVDDFTFLAPDEPSDLPEQANGNGQSNASGSSAPGSSSSASASSSVTGQGASSSSSATVTDSEGNTTTVSDSAYEEGATSSSASGSASSSPEGTEVEAIANAPAVISQTVATDEVDLLLGTAEADVLMGSDRADLIMGYGGADIFVLSHITHEKWEQSDIILDFSLIEGDQLKLPNTLKFDEISLSLTDIDGDERYDGILIESKNSEGFHAFLSQENDVSNDTLLSVSASIIISETL